MSKRTRKGPTTKHSLRITLTSFAALLATVALTASAVAAFSQIHLLKGIGPNDDGTLKTEFKIAGLGGKATITLAASADATADWVCQNNRGNFPADPKKQLLTGPVSASEQLTSTKNGQITDSLSLSPPATTLDCPSGQRAVLASVSYQNVGLSSSTGATESLSLSFSRIYFDYEK
jgi:hypothetical protein